MKATFFAVFRQDSLVEHDAEAGAIAALQVIVDEDLDRTGRIAFHHIVARGVDVLRAHDNAQ